MRALLVLFAILSLMSACSYDGELSALQCTSQADCNAPNSECIDGYCLSIDPDNNAHPDPNNSEPDPNNSEPDPNNSEPDPNNSEPDPCPDDELFCDDHCIDPAESLDHCGDCENACDGTIPDGAHHTCVTNPDNADQSACSFSCDEGLTLCGDICVDLDADPDYCGDCDHSCPLTDVCSDGSCQDDCGEGLTGCYDFCVDLHTNPDYCGNCETYCDDLEWPENSSTTCVEGECDFQCNDDFQRCGDACIGDDELCCVPDASPFGGGSGLSDDPYTLCSIDHLLELDGTDHVDHHFALTDDLDWGDASIDHFTGIGDPDHPYNAHFDGRGHTISNITIHLPDENSVGFFRTISDSASVTALALDGLQVEGRHYVGGLVGRNYGQLSQLYTEGPLIEGAFRVGGLVGGNQATITDAHSAMTLVKSTGYQDPQSDLADFADAGGFAGANSAFLHQITSTSDVLSDDKGTAGGIAAYNHGTITDAFSSGSITANTNVGGLVGYNHVGPFDIGDHQIANSYSISSIVDEPSNAGALIGFRFHNNSDSDIDPFPYSNLYYDQQLSSLPAVGVGPQDGTSGLPTPQFDSPDNFSGFEFSPDGPWSIGTAPDGEERPLLHHLID